MVSNLLSSSHVVSRRIWMEIKLDALVANARICLIGMLTQLSFTLAQRVLYLIITYGVLRASVGSGIKRPNLAGSSSSALVVVSEPDGRGKRFDRHRGGSRSAVAYSYHMGVSIKDTIYPTFTKLHYNERYDNYIGGKAIRIVDEVEAQVADLSQSLSLPEGVSPT